MRIITFQCDCCAYEKTMRINVGMQVPRVLWTFGRIELCDVCAETAQKLLNDKFKKNPNDH